jgi:Ca-activated chloride channel family protein
MTSNMYKQLIFSSAAAAIIAIASAPASAQSRLSEMETASEINAANKLLRDGKVDEALEAFRHVVPGDGQRSELNYNMAVAEYRKGNIDAAEKLFGEVAGTSAPTISSNSRYNLGNCQYTKAVQVAAQDRPTAIEHLRNAVSHYRGALRGNSNNPDARANIELAGALIRKLEQEQKQQQEEQEKQEQEQEQEQPEQKDDSQKGSEPQKSDSNDSKSDQQKEEDQKDQSEASASDKSNKEEQEKDAQTNETPGDESETPDDQKSPGEESQSRRQKPSEQQAQPKGSDGKQTQPQNMQQKSGDQRQPDDEGKQEEQEAKNQPVPDGDLKAAGQQDENKKPVASGAMADLNATDGLMSREEALKMLQSVRDRDMLRRMRQQQQERSRRVPVDRDW